MSPKSATNIKSIGKSSIAAKLASALIAPWIRLVWRTTRWTFIGRDILNKIDRREEGYILAFWHSRLLMAPAVRQESEREIFMLISNHRDGEIIANAVKGFGIKFIRGSAANPKKKFKEKSGATALMQMIAALKAGHVVGVTPDGPRGPTERAQPGIARLAAKANAPILPIAYATSNGRRLNTWDRFFLALPFSRGAFAVGEPVSAPVSDDIDAIKAAQRALEKSLNDAVKKAEEAVRRSPS